MIHTHQTHPYPRRGRLLLVWIALLMLYISGCSIIPARVYHVGILCGLDFFADAVTSFKAHMTELGYVEGQNIVYDIQSTNIDTDAYKRIIQQFVSNKVDLIFVFPTEAALVARDITRDTNIPVVFTLASIEGVDLVRNPREPGENITGVRFPAPELALKRLEIMRVLAPQARRIWLPYQRNYPSVASQLAALYPVAEDAGITLLEAPADNAADLAADLQARATAADPGLDAILILAEPLSVMPDAFVVMARFAAAHRLPIGGTLLSVGRYGSIFEVNVNRSSAGTQAATIADKVFRGTPVGTIPIIAAETSLQINYTIAQRLGVTVPQGLLKQADEIIRE